MLPYRTHIIIIFSIIIKGLRTKRIRLIVHTLLPVEPVVFDKGFNSGFLHEAVVFFRTIPGIGDTCLWKFAVTVKEGFEERDHCQRVTWSLEQFEVKDELVLRPDLQVISGLCLAVVHGILFHTHEGGIMIGLGI